ncbi:ABC transporter permease [Nocardioides sp. L-11A]|uniref:ABC transporter permease n=1 Tax=Nocardioides sp. L-11A TaxID=3043848 RepID=UPI00249B24F5|nr:ABC transporter permease [Nocardioides sp. L-11A]
MRSAILARLAALPLVVLALSALVFFLVALVPGDVATTFAGPQATADQVEQLRRDLGLDQPVLGQYVAWLTDAVRGDLGRSLANGTPVGEMLAARLPVTLSLTIAGTVAAVLIGVPAGIAAGLRPGGLLDRLVTGLSAIGVAFPSFWLGLLLVGLFALRIPVFPATGYVSFAESPTQWLARIVLPAVALGVTPAAVLARQMRSSLVEVMGSAYVRTARAKGVPAGAIVRRHALRNAAGPMVTQLGFWVTIMLGTSLIVEQVFSLPGIGGAMAHAIMQGDTPVLLGLAVVLVVLVVAINLVVDLVLMWLNPKARTA